MPEQYIKYFVEFKKLWAVYRRFPSNVRLRLCCFLCGPAPRYIKPIWEAFKGAMNGSASNFFLLEFPSAEVESGRECS